MNQRVTYCLCWGLLGLHGVKHRFCKSRPVEIISAVRRRGLIAAIAPNGRIYVAGQDQSFTGEDIVWFLNKLCGRYRKRDLLIIWDGASIHRSEAVKAFLKERPGRVHLESLPPYSPELNPVELVWSQLKNRLKNRVFLSLQDLMQAVQEQLNIFERERKLVQAFFHKKEIGFFTG